MTKHNTGKITLKCTHSPLTLISPHWFHCPTQLWIYIRSQGWGQFNSGIGIAAQFQFQFRNWNWNWNWWNWKWNWNWKPWNWNWNWNWKPELNFLLLLQQLLVNQPFPNFSFNIGGHNLSYDWLFMQQVLLGHCPLWCGHKRYLGRVPCSPWVDRGQKD